MSVGVTVTRACFFTLGPGADMACGRELSLCSSPSWHFLIVSDDDHALVPAFFAHVPALLVSLQATPEARSGLVLCSLRLNAEQARPRCQRACIPCPSLYTRCRPHTTSLILHQTFIALCAALSRRWPYSAGEGLSLGAIVVRRVGDAK